MYSTVLYTVVYSVMDRPEKVLFKVGGQAEEKMCEKPLYGTEPSSETIFHRLGQGVGES
jgi:hypothetical protein